VQTMRKESGFEILDRITLYHFGSTRVAEIIGRHQALIMEEILAEAIIAGDQPGAKEWDINGEACSLAVVRQQK
jgi:isoleucyl-tRNA synthetase